MLLITGGIKKNIKQSLHIFHISHPYFLHPFDLPLTHMTVDNWKGLKIVLTVLIVRKQSHLFAKLPHGFKEQLIRCLSNGVADDGVIETFKGAIVALIEGAEYTQDIEAIFHEIEIDDGNASEYEVPIFQLFQLLAKLPYEWEGIHEALICQMKQLLYFSFGSIEAFFCKFKKESFTLHLRLQYNFKSFLNFSLCKIMVYHLIIIFTKKVEPFGESAYMHVDGKSSINKLAPINQKRKFGPIDGL